MEELAKEPAENVTHRNVHEVLGTVRLCRTYWKGTTSLSQSQPFQDKLHEALEALQNAYNDDQVDESVLASVMDIKDDIIEAVEALRWFSIAAAKYESVNHASMMNTDLDLAQHNAQRVINDELHDIKSLDPDLIDYCRVEARVTAALNERKRHIEMSERYRLAVAAGVILIIVGMCSSPDSIFLRLRDLAFFGALLLLPGLLAYFSAKQSAKEVYVPNAHLDELRAALLKKGIIKA